MKRLNQFSIFHFGSGTYPFTIEPWKRIPDGNGFLVNFFFVLSGFIFAYVYYPHAQGGFNWKAFMVKRLSRFYPLYLVSLIIMILFLYQKSSNPVFVGILEVFMLHAWVPSSLLGFNFPDWAMSVFFSFYLIFPSLYTWLVKIGFKRSVRLVIVFWVISQVVAHVLDYYWFTGERTISQNFLMFNPIMHLNPFLIGIIGGFYFRQNGDKEEITQTRNLVGLFTSMLLLVFILFFRRDLQELTPFRLLYSRGLIAPIHLWMIMNLARDTSRVSRFLSARWMVWLGDISFSIYLLQAPVHRFYKEFLLARFEYHFPWTEQVHFYLILLMLLVAASLSRWLFEIPAQKFIRKKFLR